MTYSKIVKTNPSIESFCATTQDTKNLSHNVIVSNQVSNEENQLHQLTNQLEEKIETEPITPIDTYTQLQQQSSTNTTIEWLVKLLDDLENQVITVSENEWLDLFCEAENKAKTLIDFEQHYSTYWDRLYATYPQSPETPPSPPSLYELKALLLACETLGQLNNLEKQHPSKVKEAYDGMSQEQQIKVDGLKATTVPHEVYKYIGNKKQVDGQVIEPGTLVYLDPQTNNKNRLHLKVRLLEGLNQSWQKVIEISRDALQAVEKVVNDGLDVLDVQQDKLLDGLN